MTNPLLPAVEVWLSIFTNLPEPIKLVFSVSLTLLSLLIFFHIIYKIRS